MLVVNAPTTILDPKSEKFLRVKLPAPSWTAPRTSLIVGTSRNAPENTKNGTRPSHGSKERPDRAVGTVRAPDGSAAMDTGRSAEKPLAFLYLSGTTTPTVVGQPAAMAVVALVIWSSVGRKAPEVSGSFAFRSAGIAFRLTMSS